MEVGIPLCKTAQKIKKARRNLFLIFFAFMYFLPDLKIKNWLKIKLVTVELF